MDEQLAGGPPGMPGAPGMPERPGDPQLGMQEQVTEESTPDSRKLSIEDKSINGEKFKVVVESTDDNDERIDFLLEAFSSKTLERSKSGGAEQPPGEEQPPPGAEMGAPPMEEAPPEGLPQPPMM